MNGLDESHSRNMLEIMVCEKLFMSVDGSAEFKNELPNLGNELTKTEMEEYKSYTMTNIWTLTGWTKSINKMSEMSISHVKKYLSKSGSQYFTPDMLRKYKCTRACQHVEATHIHSVECHLLPKSPTFCLACVRCCPSQSIYNLCILTVTIN